MPRFDLSQYETVESRIKRFYEEYPDGRIATEWENSGGWGQSDSTPPRMWVVKAAVYLSAGDQANNLPKATGYAHETDGTGGANNVDALANGETSAIGRALANMGMSGNKRASREEMQKVNNLIDRDWVAEATKITDVTALRWLYAQAKGAGAPEEQLERIQAHAEVLSAGGENKGADRGVSAGSKGQK